MKYAQVERERRFLVPGPVDLSSAGRVLEIQDAYIAGTRLRLRTVHEAGQVIVRKLGHKVRFDASAPGWLAHTTMYLDEAEHRMLAELPSSTLAKTRHILPLEAGRDIAVDVFGGSLSGLVLAEVDLGSSGAMPETLPAWLGHEVTDDERFAGGALAASLPADLRALLHAGSG
jgi:CYTH domain-containing protein